MWNTSKIVSASRHESCRIGERGNFMIELFFIKPLLFIFSSPQEWILVIVAVSLLFGAKKLPELAKSLGQTRKAFKEGMREAEEDEAKEKETLRTLSPLKPAVTEIDDETLLEEIRRRREKAAQLESN